MSIQLWLRQGSLRYRSLRYGSLRHGPLRYRLLRHGLLGLWLLVLVGLGLQAWRQSSLVGSYDAYLDQLLHAGQRRLAGELTYRDFVNGTPVVAQYLYAPSALLAASLGTLRPHRLLMLALSLAGGGLLWSGLRQLGALGWLALRRDSLVPPFAALLYVVFVQLFPLGFSGLLPSIVDTLLVLALALILWSVSMPAGFRRASLALAGAMLLLIINALPALFSPLLLSAVLLVLLQPPRRPWAWLVPILGGGIGALLLLLLPYMGQPGGLEQVWAGAVQLPLELARRSSPSAEPLQQQLGDLLTQKPAGLPLWLFALIPVLELLRRWRTGGRSLLLVPAIATIFSVDLLLAQQLQGIGRNQLQLLVLPVVLLISAGLASLESSPRIRMRRVALVTVLLLSLVLANNLFVAVALHPPPPPSPPLLELEHDRAAVRAFVAALDPSPGALQAPQDTAMLRELSLPASGVGVGPDWSLDQQQLPSSWAARRLGLPLGATAACDELIAAPHGLVVWLRTDPRGPNSKAALRACLARDSSRWQPLGEQLALSSGQVQLFRRLQPLSP